MLNHFRDFLRDYKSNFFRYRLSAGFQHTITTFFMHSKRLVATYSFLFLLEIKADKIEIVCDGGKHLMICLPAITSEKGVRQPIHSNQIVSLLGSSTCLI